jgi:hypothetical protein
VPSVSPSFHLAVPNSHVQTELKQGNGRKMTSEFVAPASCKISVQHPRQAWWSSARHAPGTKRGSCARGNCTLDMDVGGRAVLQSTPRPGHCAPQLTSPRARPPDRPRWRASQPAHAGPHRAAASWPARVDRLHNLTHGSPWPRQQQQQSW